MGLREHEVRFVTLKEFNLMLTGYLAKQDREWDRTRNLMSFIANFSGMGIKEPLRPQDIRPLPQDREGVKKMIKSTQQAQQLLKEFE